MSDGDALNIKAGTYTETGLNLSNASAEIWFEIGVLIDPVSGTALTISGNSCKLTGMHKITPAAGQIGLLISGNECHIEHGKILAGGTGIRITGSGTMLNNYASGNQTIIAYDVQGSQSRLTMCSTVGVGATYGYKINGSSDTGVLRDCTSVGHTTSGFYIDTGSQDWTILNCSSGASDGKWRDIDNANVWSNFSYDKVKTSAGTLDANAETKSYAVAQIYGQVVISKVHIEVITALSSNIRNFYLNIWDGATNVPISANSGLTLDSAPIGSLITRLQDSSVVMDYQSGATCFIAENTSFRDVQTEVIVGAKGDGTPTYLRFTYTTSNTPSSGSIQGYIEWEPISGDGFVKLL